MTNTPPSLACGHEGHDNHDVTCDRLVNDLLLEYFEGSLPASQRATFDEHLSQCEACVRYVDSYRKTVEAARACGKDPALGAPTAPPEGVVKAILDAAKKAGLCGGQRGRA